MPEDYFRPKYKYNTLTRYYLRRLRKYGTVSKLLHADPSFIDKTPDTDLVYYVLYTLNKHRRWESFEDMSTSLMNSLQALNQEMDILVFDRYFVDPFRAHISYCVPHFMHNLDGAKIKSYYEKKSHEEEYTERKFKGVGRWYGTDTKKEHGETTTMKVVSYNLVRGPKNYVKYFADDFKAYPKKWVYGFVRKSTFDPMTTFFDWKEYDNQYFDEDSDYDYLNETNNSHDDFDEIYNQPSKYYNFSDHFVISSRCRKLGKRTAFVFV